jgi:hypothetical protein
MKIIITFFLTFLLLSPLAFAKKMASLPDLQTPYMIKVDSERIYISDQCGIFFYNINELKEPVAKFGQKGSGPREFLRSPDIQIYEDEIIASTAFKLIIVSKTGTLIKEIKYPNGFYPQTIKRIKNNYAAICSGFSEKRMSAEIALYDHEFKKIASFNYSPLPKRNGSKRIPLLGSKSFLDCSKENIFLIESGREGNFVINIFDSHGKKLESISGNLPKRLITDSDEVRIKNEFLERISKRMKSILTERKREYSFPKYFPAFKDVCISGDLIYFKTYKIIKNMEEYAVLTTKGKLIKRIVLPRTPYLRYAIYGKNFYFLVENEETEEWELHFAKIAQLRLK